MTLKDMFVVSVWHRLEHHFPSDVDLAPHNCSAEFAAKKMMRWYGRRLPRCPRCAMRTWEMSFAWYPPPPAGRLRRSLGNGPWPERGARWSASVEATLWR